MWSLFSIIVFLLLVGLAKMNWNVNWYVDFLNTNDWSVFHWSEVSTWADPFWPTTPENVSIEEVLSDDEVGAEIDLLDVYDPSFEEDLNTISDDSMFSGEEDFGFTTNK